VAAERASPLRFERSALADGTELVVQPAPAGSASFAVTYLGPSGWAFDPNGREGLSLLATELAVCGGGRRDRREIARLLDRSGGTLGSQCHPECGGLTLWGPAAHLETLLPLLADAVRRPRFDGPELERVRRQLVERQMRERSQPDRAAEKALLRRIFPASHPYRETGIGSSESIARVRREDLRAFHRRRTKEGGAVLAYTGRLPARTFEKAWRAAGGEAEGPLPSPTPHVDPPPARAGSFERIEVAGGSQVEVRIGGPALARHDPEFVPAFLANEVLGGRSVLSRLFQELRERRGLVYHAASSLEAMSWGGYWSAEAGTEPKAAEEVLQLLENELRRIRTVDVPAAELDRIRTSAIGSLALELESTADAHELAVEVAYYRLPVGFYADWPATLKAVRASEIREAAAVLFDPARTTRVLAGPLAEGETLRRLPGTAR
jgi:zinc protease